MKTISNNMPSSIPSRIKNYIEENIEKCIRYSPSDEDKLIGIPYPYTVPSTESFNELYYWDSYFTNLGLIRIGKADLAKNNTDNMLYLVDKLGKMPNGNRTYFLNRSQPPFLSEMVKDVFGFYKDKVWLEGAYKALCEEYTFWNEKRNSPVGLNHYDSEYTDETLEEYKIMFIDRVGEVDSSVDTNLGRHCLATAESGWDMNPRFEFEAYNYGAIDLNCLLYGFENNMKYFAEVLENGESQIWKNRAEARLEKMNRYMINSDGVFVDYNFDKDKHSNVFSAASYFALFNNAANKEQAEALVNNLSRIEEKFGIATCEKGEYGDITYQWDYPNGWPCLHYIVIKGLDNYGYKTEAKRVAEKYVALVENVFEKTENFWEKYNVTDGSINVSNEYKMPTMLGWSAGVYIFAKEYLDVK